MKNTAKNIIITFICAAAFSICLFACGCTKVDVPKGTPKCIKQEIKETIKNKTCLKNVHEYDYNGRKVYFFQDDAKQCSEACGYLMDENCLYLKGSNGTSICGCAFGQLINCNDFFQNRTNEKLIWEK